MCFKFLCEGDKLCCISTCCVYVERKLLYKNEWITVASSVEQAYIIKWLMNVYSMTMQQLSFFTGTCNGSKLLLQCQNCISVLKLLSILMLSV